MDWIGINKETDLVLYAQDNPELGDSALLSGVINRLAECEVPVVFWAGYSGIFLVSSVYLKDWTVVVSRTETSVERIFPRRWLDIKGRKMMDVWEAGLKAVVGVILVHPGMSQVRKEPKDLIHMDYELIGLKMTG